MKSNAALSPLNLPDKIPDADFEKICRLSLEATGISIDETKRSMVYSRFSRRLRDLQLDTFAEYLELLSQGNHEELTHFINTITTNLTYFFREPHHFEYLKEHALPKLRQSLGASHALRVWSSACSSGQEAYSIAMTLAESPDTSGWRTRILATDIDTDMVERTRAGIYGGEALRGLDTKCKEKWFEQQPDGDWQMREALRQVVMPKSLNLFDDWPFKPGVDIIFCRNVLIYFDDEHQAKLQRKFADCQKPGSLLFLGHSESLKGGLPYRRVSNTVYERT